MKRIALIAAAVVLTACGGATEEAAPVAEEQPAAAVMETPSMDSAMPDSSAAEDTGASTPDSATM